MSIPYQAPAQAVARPTPAQAPASAAKTGITSVQYLLRLEGLAVATVSALFYARTGASWWLFAALWLMPDLSMLGYLSAPCRGARIYNAFHTYTLPVTLGLCGLLLHARGIAPFALIWINHIGFDRMMGYGLKYADGFHFTHLGMTGKRKA
jgi:hypothetical protein